MGSVLSSEFWFIGTKVKEKPHTQGLLEDVLGSLMLIAIF